MGYFTKDLTVGLFYSLKNVVSYLKKPLIMFMPYIFFQGNLTLASIELHSHGYMSVPLSWTDPNVASFNDRLKVMTNNCIRVCVPLKTLSERKNSRSLHIETVFHIILIILKIFRIFARQRFYLGSIFSMRQISAVQFCTTVFGIV